MTGSDGDGIPPPRLDSEVGGGALLSEGLDASVGAMLAARAAVEPARVAVRSRSPAGKWTDLTWARLDEQRRGLATGLLALGVQRGDRVAVVANNSVEMLLAEAAIVSAGAVSVPIFPDYAQEVLEHCLSNSGARLAFAGSAVQQRRIAGARGLEKICVLDDQPLPDGTRALPFKSLGQPAQELPQVRADELAFLLYTSGTTGKPKGVELTHGNALSQQAAIAQVWDVSERDVFLSSLPWHHCFGALFERLMALWNRALLVVDDSRGRDLDRLLQNWAEVKPTVYFGVPRVFNAIASRAQRDAKAEATVLHPGLRFVFSAAAPLGGPCFRYFEEHGVPVLEGWGMTETSPCVTLTTPKEPRAPGVVGFPLPGATVKLEPVEGIPGRGEVLVRGNQVMRGYHRRPADTARVLQEGWLHTGDLAEWTPHGLRLHGRTDGVFKLENGEKVSSGEVEARVVSATPLLEQALVLGSGQPFVTALCWLAPGPARRFLEEQGLDVPESPAELVRVPELRRAVAEALQAANLLTSTQYERLRRVALVPEAPSLETGELTPTLKVVRKVSEARHQQLIAAMREEAPHELVLELARRGDAFQHA